MTPEEKVALRASHDRIRSFMAPLERDILAHKAEAFSSIQINPNDLDAHKANCRPGATRFCWFSVELVADATVPEGAPVLVRKGR